ncbi:hypothetical protein CH352_00190 [Leptospira hartskeerlii]|uniref:Uncharacterized protein n=2 Tax=Leptospira TaxID=171 RepID=A0ABX4PVH9_9LEPT|nr:MULTISPECIES: hypothetical protein [Leptospira]PJZ24214.1 hypothetical protein CH357_17295 [Leptospira hartskeerlii]PJZ35559.1 hypothetical protein CH352_00190 [Leptospira hartskeerlii]PKA18049.1 hypothetical protein CH363_04225 [Leptospira haakeii]PKA21862.1 hypothetical protein CH377_04225 [Leptospira haakeii]
MSKIKDLFNSDIRTSYLKESWKEEDWYESLAGRPGIEQKIPYFKKGETSSLKVAVLSR